MKPQIKLKVLLLYLVLHTSTARLLCYYFIKNTETTEEIHFNAFTLEPHSTAREVKTLMLHDSGVLDPI